MSYQSLYRRYRPRRFGEVRGQQHLVTAMRNAVRDERVGHAYLLSGPRGTGKTTTARVLAKVLNCEAPVDGEPCLECASCQDIEAGTSFDLHELDAASNNGVGDMRELISKASFGTPGRTKVYILDEVHMLSPGAEAALLKTLEEPPDHVVFVLATTDPQRVNATIRSRTQHFELHLLPADELDALVREVIADAGLDVDEASIAHVLRIGAGSARDTLSALDQVVAAGGLDERGSSIDELLAALLERDPGAVLAAVHTAVGAGREPRVLGQELVMRLRDVFLASVGVALDHLPELDRVHATELSASLDRPFLTRALDVLGTALVDMRQAADARITLETALVRLADVGSDSSNVALLERLERLERALVAGGVPAPVPPAAAAPATPAAAPAPTPTPASAGPGTAAGPGPAEEARRKLAARGAGASRPNPPAASPPAPRAATQAPSPSPAPATTGAAPVARDELLAAWTDHVLPGLSGLAKALFAAGRLIEVADGALVFALPNEVHRNRCEELRAEVEAALVQRLGGPVSLRLVVDTPAGSTPAAGAPAAPAPEEEIDLDELVDVPAEAVRSGADKVVEAFPGAELVDKETR